MRPTGITKFSLIVITTAIVLYAVPFPSAGMVKRLLQIHSSRATVAIVGPSTIDYVSNCDTDRRTVPAMISELAGRSVLDLSVGGQPLSDSLNLAALSGGAPSITDVVLPIAYPYSDDSTTPAYSRLLIYKALMPRFAVFAAASVRDFWSGLTGKPERVERGYRFEGRSYPDYRKLSAGELAREKSLASCPEVVSHNPAFTRSYFWWGYVEVQENPGLYQLVTALDARLARGGKRLHVVVLPSNLEVLGRFDRSWAGIVRNGEARLVARLTRRGIHVIDLSSGFASNEFSTQWCGCIHLNEKGRLHISEAIAAAVASRPATRILPIYASER